MIMGCWWIWELFLSLCAISTVVLCANVTICPTKGVQSAFLENFHHYVACDDSQCPPIPVIDSLWQQSSEPSVIIVLYSNSITESKTIESLSECYSSTILVNVTFVDTLEPLMFTCHHGKTIVVVNLAGHFSDDLPYFNATECMIDSIGEHGPLASVVRYCQNVIWVTPTMEGSTLPCNGSNLQAVRMYQESASSEAVLNWIYMDNGSFANKTFKVATLAYGPFVRSKVVGNRTQFYGIVIEMLDQLASRLHFKYILVVPEDHAFGSTQGGPNLTFNGMVGMAQRKEVDLIAAALTVTAIRSEVIDFAEAAYYFEFIAIMVTKPESVTQMWQWVKLFDWKVWILTLGVIVAGSLYLFALHSWNGFWIVSRFRQPFACFWHVGFSLVNQDTKIEPVTMASQTFLGFYWIFAVGFIACFSSSLIAVLTTETMDFPFQTVDGLADRLIKGEYKMCTIKDTNFYNDIMIKNDPAAFVAMRNFLKKNMAYAVENGDDCITYMKSDPHVAFVGDMSLLEDYQTNDCDNVSFVILQDRFAPGFFSLAFQKDSPYTSTFSAMILDMIEKDLITQWRKNYTQRTVEEGGSKTKCEIIPPDATTKLEMKPLTVSEFGGVFCLLPIGYLLGILMFVYEKARFKKPPEKKQRPVFMGRRLVSVRLEAV